MMSRMNSPYPSPMFLGWCSNQLTTQAVMPGLVGRGKLGMRALFLTRGSGEQTAGPERRPFSPLWGGVRTHPMVSSAC